MFGSASAVHAALDAEGRVLCRYFNKNPSLGAQCDFDTLIAKQNAQPVNPNELIEENIQQKKFKEA